MKLAKVKLDIFHNTAVISLNNPTKLNAWDFSMRKKIYEIIQYCKKNKKIKSVIITGSGNKSFCSGQDLNEISNNVNVDKWIDSFKKVYYAIRSLEKPVLACVNGVAAGSGFQLALLADIIVTHKNARFGQVEINNGIASVTGPAIMKIFLGMSKTIELTLTGKLINGLEAFKLGFIHKLVSQKKVFSTTLQFAKELEKKSSHAMLLTKKNFWQMMKKDFDSAFAEAKKIHRVTFKKKTSQQMIKKFLNS
jgi:enoyl-CoA hydratase